MNYANIKYCDIANGEGVRTTLFVSGCTLHCKNCFNKVAWDFGYGQPFDKATRNALLESLAPQHIDGLSVLGGEPFEPQNQRGLVSFLHDVKVLYPDKTIWCYTGFVYERDLLKESHARCEVTDEMLAYLDVLVDGAFEQDQYDISLRFKGSANQRLIDLNRTRETGVLTLWQGDPLLASHSMD
ncbi:MAG: anaerobic ribonucleoside-triphosphate reductase activating protein [Gemmiger sp.]|nr:anaerobic ribonucleoside-triphosphate reductase activating protein [Gemmiger sp.]